MDSMKKCLVLLSLLLAASGVRAALPDPDLIAQIHFAGARKIFAAANAAAFTNEFRSAEAAALRAQTAEKLSRWLAGWLQQNAGAAAADGAAKLRPLLDDLQAAEWFLQARAGADGQPRLALAIRLDAARTAVWQASLKSLFASAPVKWDMNSGGGLFFFNYGADSQAIRDDLSRTIPLADRAWLSLDVNWPRLARWYPQLGGLGLPETQFTLTAPDANLHLDGRFLFPENLSLNLESWRMPTNTIHPPLVSFTAARGFSSWLKSQPWWARTYSVSPAPDQLFVWALPHSPFQTFAAAPCPDAADALTQAYARLLPVFNGPDSAGHFMMPFPPRLTNTEISWSGVPFIAPFLRALKEPAGQFLFGGAFPNSAKSPPLPPELFARLATPGLVFYHWENAAARAPQMLNFSQLSLLLTAHRQLGVDSAGLKWIQKTVPALGNNVTLVTRTGPAELTFSRKSAGLFTSVEIFTLANWLEAPDFPGCNLRLPPRTVRPHPKLPGALPAH